MINIKEVNKIARMIGYPKPNLPVPAVLVVCCLIDTLARNYPESDRCLRFAKYIKEKMQKTFEQLRDNDSLKSQQISIINCDFKGHDKKKCKTSAEILFRHIRCGLVHNYFESEGYAIINKPNGKQKNIIIDQSKENGKYALVLNGPAFVRDFLASFIVSPR